MAHIASIFPGNLVTLLCHPITLFVLNTPDLYMIYWLAKTPHLLRLYSNIIEEQKRKEFTERIDDNKKSPSVHYIPHHTVRKESSTTPIRIIYNCSCKQSPSSPVWMTALTQVLSSSMIFVQFHYIRFCFLSGHRKSIFTCIPRWSWQRFYMLPVAIKPNWSY